MKKSFTFSLFYFESLIFLNMKLLNNEFDFVSEIPMGSLLKYEIDKNSNLIVKEKR